MSEGTSLSKEFITTVIFHRVRPSRREGYEKWLKGIAAAARTFEGHLGVSIFRHQSNNTLDYTLVVHFKTADRLLGWLNSDTRKMWIERAVPLLLEPEKIQTLTGLEAWFELPKGMGVPSRPNRHKQFVLVWVGVMLVSMLRQPLIDPLLANFPPIVAMGGRVAVSVGCLSYLVMPQLTRVFKGWLYPSA